MSGKTICNFAVVRFLPYPETDEFVAEYGDKWCRRIERLRDMGSYPRRLLFVLRQPAGGRGLQAAEEVRRELRAHDVETLDEREEDAVLDFARTG